ncbi:hypothetical protein K2P47_00250 [Patescibacteria group bacterium]|nr:hypothetical protein [Patescibacteria group bacterium]
MFKGFAFLIVGGLVGWLLVNIFPNDEITPVVIITATTIFGFYFMWKEAEEDNKRE